MEEVLREVDVLCLWGWQSCGSYTGWEEKGSSIIIRVPLIVLSNLFS